MQARPLVFSFFCLSLTFSSCDSNFSVGMGSSNTASPSVSVNAAWDGGSLQSASTIANLIPLSGPSIAIPVVSIASGRALNSRSGVAAGNYALVEMLVDGSVPKAGACEIVEVAEGQSIQRLFDFSAASGGSWKVGTAPPASAETGIALGGWSDSILLSDALVLTASAPSVSTNSVYIWRIDGDARSIGYCYNLNATGDKLAVGNHLVTVERRPVDGSAGETLAKTIAVALPPSGSDSLGWQLNGTNSGLARLGVDKSKLALYSGPAKPVSGTTISDKRIETCLDLSAGGVTIERCWIHPLTATKGNHLIVTYDNNNAQAPAPAMVTIRDSDIDGTAIDAYTVCGALAFSGGGTIQRCNIYGAGSGIGVWHAGTSLPVIVEGNYIHGLRAWGDPATTGSHNDGFTVREYRGPSVIVRNNRIDCSSGNDTGAFFIQPYSGFIDNVLAQGNLLEGLGYQMIVERNNYDYGTHLRSVNNRFSCTGFGAGYVDKKGLGYGWAEWNGNFRNDASKADNQGAIVTI
jgi:hypothetical protein